MNQAISNPKITIIIAVYNGAKTLSACLTSIEHQTYKNLEIIVMDGGSSDETVKILEEHSNHIQHWESSPDRGIYHAWNKALLHATGEWIYFLGADDVLHDNHVLQKFSEKVSNLQSRPLVAYGKIEYCNKNARTVMGEDWRKIKNKITTGMAIPHQGIFHNRLLFEKCGSFDEKFQIAGDYQLILRSLRYDSPHFLGDFIIADQYAGGKSSLRKLRWKVLNEFREAQKGEGLSLTLGWVFAYAKAMAWRFVL